MVWGSITDKWEKHLLNAHKLTYHGSTPTARKKGRAGWWITVPEKSFRWTFVIKSVIDTVGGEEKHS